MRRVYPARVFLPAVRLGFPANLGNIFGMPLGGTFFCVITRNRRNSVKFFVAFAMEKRRKDDRTEAMANWKDFPASTTLAGKAAI